GNDRGARRIERCGKRRPRCRIVPARTRQEAGGPIVNVAAADIDDLRRLQGADERPKVVRGDEELRSRHGLLHNVKETVLGLSPKGATASSPALRIMPQTRALAKSMRPSSAEAAAS